MYIQPSAGDVHVNRPLTNISLAYLQSADNFVADKVFQNIPVNHKSDVYFTYDRFDFNRDEMRERAPGTESVGSTYKIGTDSYLARVRAFHRDVADEIRANSDDPLNQDREATLFVTNKALINRERIWASRFFVTGAPGAIWSYVADGVTNGSRTAAGSYDPTNASNNDIGYWNEAASTPIEDVRFAKTYVQERTGFRPNVLTLGRRVYDALIDHPDIVGRIDRGQTTGPALANREALAALFEVDEILVMDSVYTSTDEGATTQTTTFIAGKLALLTYRPPSPGIMTPAAGYMFSWNGFLGATNNGMRIKRFRMEHLESDRIEIQAAYDMKKVAADLGFLFNGIVQ